MLKKLDAKYPEGDVIRIVCDNHSAQKSKETRNYLATRPEGRFVFVFTPKLGSWLNMIESFFNEMDEISIAEAVEAGVKSNGVCAS